VAGNPLKHRALAPEKWKKKTTMPYVRIWVHLIWSTKDRMPLLNEALRGRLFTHIKENASKKDIYLDTINGTEDHVHSLVSLKPDQTIAKVAQLLKGESSHWVNDLSAGAPAQADQNIGRGKFEWQDEYIAVSVNESMKGALREYIKNQAEHHRKKTFSEEYQEFMGKYGFSITPKKTMKIPTGLAKTSRLGNRTQPKLFGT
jgi:putative transposase